MQQNTQYNELLAEINELKYRLDEANETIDAIRSGQVDALVVNGDDGPQLFTLKSADQTYRVFIEKMAEGAVTLNEEGMVLYSNSRFANLLNLPLESVIGVHFKTFVCAIDKTKFERLVKSGWLADSKDEILLKNKGENRSYLLSCNTMQLDEGVALSIIITDLTVQKEIQAELKIKNYQLEKARRLSEKLNNELEATVIERTRELYASREHFKTLADNLPQMIWTNLPDGTINFFNKQWHEYTGIKGDDAGLFSWDMVIHPSDIAETLEKYKTALRFGLVYEVENRYKRKADGIYRWHLNRGIPLKNESGDIILWVGTATDIEDQKKAMDKKDEFIAIASHELKTPLTSLKGYLQIINSYKKDDLPTSVRAFITKAIEAVNKLQYLVNDLLDVSKINAGRLEYGMNTLRINELISTCVESANHIYNTHHISGNALGNYTVYGNFERLEQVLMNFISNAVKYSAPDNQIVISAKASGSNVRVSVQDFGIGLSELQKEKIFERFYRVEDKRFLASGLGMGLYICTEIIKTHQGNIGVQSEYGKGSTFYFELPLHH